MHTPTHTAMQIVISTMAVIGFCHIARPLALSAQSSATIRVEASVLPAAAAWAAHRMTEVAIRAGPAIDRSEESGAFLWRDEDPADSTVQVVTVAHLGS